MSKLNSTLPGNYLSTNTWGYYIGKVVILVALNFLNKKCIGTQVIQKVIADEPLRSIRHYIKTY